MGKKKGKKKKKSDETYWVKSHVVKGYKRRVKA
jgi:hypothetical protein